MDSSDGLNVGDVTGPRWAGGTRNPDGAAFETTRSPYWQGFHARDAEVEVLREQLAAAEARADRNERMRSDAYDAMVKARADANAAEAVIEKAPHARFCHSHFAVGFPSKDYHECDYWKSESRPVVLAAHDREVAARTLEAAADDYYGDTHIPGLSAMTWLRERAAALRSGTEGSGQ